MCDPISAVIGGLLNKSKGGSFTKGALLGATTGGAGLALENLTGNKLTGKKANASTQTGLQAKAPETIKTPTMADATQAGDSQKRIAGMLGNQNIKTSPLGLGSSATTQKKRLLGQ